MKSDHEVIEKYFKLNIKAPEKPEHVNS